MTDARSSSNRGLGPCDALVNIGDRQVGVIRLPETRADDFIAHFNRTYQSLGMNLSPLPRTSNQKKIPVSNKADGDSSF